VVELRRLEALVNVLVPKARRIGRAGILGYEIAACTEIREIVRLAAHRIAEEMVPVEESLRRRSCEILASARVDVAPLLRAPGGRAGRIVTPWNAGLLVHDAHVAIGVWVVDNSAIYGSFDDGLAAFCNIKTRLPVAPDAAAL
jgi:hypothetical protein